MPDVICPIDGTKFHLSPSQFARTKNPTCSPDCRRKAMGGRDHWNYKGGRFTDPEGYIRVLQPDGSYEYAHRVVAEKHLKRRLRRHEMVRHKNGNRADNRWRNLVVVAKRARRGSRAA